MVVSNSVAKRMKDRMCLYDNNAGAAVAGMHAKKNPAKRLQDLLIICSEK